MSPLPRLLAAAAPSTALPEQPTLLENLEFQAVGLVIVLGALTMLYLICAVLGALFRRAESAAAKRESARRAAPMHDDGAPASDEAARADDAAAVASAETEIPVVVIAAAVAAVLDRPRRLVKVVPVSAGWSLEGRRQLLTSHQPRH
jgi:hypothetical protein